MEKSTGIKVYKFGGEEYVRKNEATRDYLASMAQRGMVYLTMVDVLTEEYGKEKALQLLGKAVFKWGEFFGKQLKEQGCKTVRDMADKWCVPLEELAIGYEEVESSENHVKVTLTTCCHQSAWEAMGIPKEEWPQYCHIAEQVDLGLAKPLGLKLGFGKLICKGDDVCEVIIKSE